MKSHPYRQTSLAALLVVSGASLGAQTPASQPAQQLDLTELDLLELLDTPVTGASKREQRLIESPQAIEVLTAEDIRQMGIYRIQDALKLMTGVDILEADNGFSAVGMRGIMQQGQPRTVQVLIDGVPIYNAFASCLDINNLPLPIDVIDRIEVVRGPSSTLYGANAVVGVIAITTKKAGDGIHGDARLAKADKGTSRWSAAMEAGFGNFGVTAGYQGAAFGNSGRTASEVGDVNHLWPYILDADDPQAKNRKPDASHQSAGLARMDWKNEHTSLWFSAAEGYKKVGRTQNLQSRYYDNKSMLAGWHETWSSKFSTELRVHRVNTTFHFHIDDIVATGYKTLHTLLGGTFVDISGDYTFGDVTTTQMEVQANWDPSKDLHFVMGADHRKVESNKVIFLGLNEDENITASGGFLAMDWTFTTNWTLSLGARAENEGLGGSRTSPRATLVWSPTKASVLRLGYFTSTRSPQLAEQNINYAYGYPNPNVSPSYPYPYLATHIIPNALLKPEKSTNIELGYRQSMGPVTLDVTLYQMKISNQIAQPTVEKKTLLIPTGYPPPLPPLIPVPDVVYQFQNLGSATNKGLELALTWMVEKDWKVGLNGRYLDYTQDDLANAKGNPASWNGEFSYAPKNVVTAWTRLKHGGFTGYLDVQHIGAAHVEALSATGAPLFDERPAYIQCDVQVGYEFVKGFSVGLYARNTAREYTFQGASGPDRPPIYQVQRRELGVNLTYRF